MKIHIHAIGDAEPSWITEGIKNYSKRFTYPFSIALHTYPTPKRSKNPSISTLQKKEHLLLTQHIAKSAYIVVLDEKGHHFDSMALSAHLAPWQGQEVHFLLGGPDGHASDTKSLAHLTLSLSKLTFPHGMARLFLVEQLYRASTIMQHHPYHRL